MESNQDQAQPLRDFIAQQNAETEANRVRLQGYADEFDRLTDPYAGEPHRDQRTGCIVVDKAPRVREEFDDYRSKLARFKGGV